MLLNNIGRNLEAFAVLGVHRNAVDQLVAVGELLVIELIFQRRHLNPCKTLPTIQSAHQALSIRPDVYDAPGC